MSTKHYRNAAGEYLGGFGDGAAPPDGAILCPAPARGDDSWDGSAWSSRVATKADVSAELDEQVARILSSDMLELIKWLRRDLGLPVRSTAALKTAFRQSLKS